MPFSVRYALRTSLSIAFLASAIAGCAEEPAEEVVLPLCTTLPASKNIGHKLFERSYDLPWSDPSTTPRTINVHVWYPTDDADGSAPKYIGLWTYNLSFDNATPKTDRECRSPVYVYSHGYRGWGGNVVPTIKNLVREGWIVVAPDHTDNILTDDEDLEPGFDLIRALDMVQSLATATANQKEIGALDPDMANAIVGGHSYGGQTAWMFSGLHYDTAKVKDNCTEIIGGSCNPKIVEAYGNWPKTFTAVPKAIVALDGGLGKEYFNALATNPEVPAMYMTATETTDNETTFEKSAKGSYWVYLQDGCHESFTATDAFDCPIEKERGLEITRTYLEAYLYDRLAATDGAVTSTDPVLTGDKEVDPAVRFLRK